MVPPQGGDDGRQSRERRCRVARAAHARAIPRRAQEGHRAGFQRGLLGHQDTRHVCLRLLRPGALRRGHEVRFRDGLAELLGAGRRGSHRHRGGPQPVHAADRSAVQPLRRASGPCVQRWAAADRAALLPQFGGTRTQAEVTTLRRIPKRLRIEGPWDSVFFGWRVVAVAFVFAVFAWGVAFYGPSVFLHALHQARGWPVSLISAAITAHFLVGAVLVAYLDDAHRRLGVVATTRAGVMALAAGTVSWSLAEAPWQLFAAAPLALAVALQTSAEVLVLLGKRR